MGNDFVYEENMKLAVEAVKLSFLEFRNPKESTRANELNKILKGCGLTDDDWEKATAIATEELIINKE